MLKPESQRLFDQIVTLRQRERLPHALLLQGDCEQASKLSLELQSFLLCQDPSPKACGQCSACRLKDTHPDKRSLGESGQAISIDEVRELTSFLSNTAHQHGYKIITLFRADLLSKPVANALLKILEEPSSNTIFVLTAQGPVLPTLKSRCFSCLLPHHTGIDEIVASLQQASWAKALIDALLERRYVAFDNELVQQFIQSQPREALYLIYCWLSNYVKFSETGDLHSSENIFRYEMLASLLGVAQALSVLSCVLEKIEALSLAGINKSLLFESFFSQWNHITAHEHTRGHRITKAPETGGLIAHDS